MPAAHSTKLSDTTEPPSGRPWQLLTRLPTSDPTYGVGDSPCGHTMRRYVSYNPWKTPIWDYSDSAWSFKSPILRQSTSRSNQLWCGCPEPPTRSHRKGSYEQLVLFFKTSMLCRVQCWKRNNLILVCKKTTYFLLQILITSLTLSPWSLSYSQHSLSLSTSCRLPSEERGNDVEVPSHNTTFYWVHPSYINTYQNHETAMTCECVVNVHCILQRSGSNSSIVVSVCTSLFWTQFPVSTFLVLVSTHDVTLIPSQSLALLPLSVEHEGSA